MRAQGYGRANIGGRRATGAHRYAWELAFGPIPKGVFILHKCDVRNCVNPDHLFLGSHSDNMEDMDRKGRRRQVRGENHGMSKLTNTVVSTIRLLESTMPQVEIAKKFDIPKTTVNAILRGRTWRHLLVTSP